MTDQAKKQVLRRRKSLSDKRRKKRLFLLALVLFLGSGAFLFHKEKFYAISEVYKWLQQNKPGEIAASPLSSSVRGDIYDRNFRPLAATYKTYAIYARPLEMEDTTPSASLLAEILGLDNNKLLLSLKSERGFVWVARGIDQDLVDTIEKHNIAGVYQVVESKRFYPNNETAAHAVGFVENDQGLDGIEFQYNTLLKGDAINKAELEALHFSSADDFGRSGANLVLNLDLMIQTKIERFLEKRAKVTGAANGAVLLMNANTGAILAMASYPPFNPNRYWEFSSSILNNHALTEPVYPGELALIFQQAAAINLNNERKAQASESMNGEESLLVIVPDKIKRRKFSVAPHVDYVEPEYLARFAQLLGFGQKPSTDLALKDETPVSENLILNDSFFHSSALRLLTAFTALFNNGRIVTPHILHKAYSRENSTPLEPDLSPSEQAAVLHPATTKALTDFLAVKWLKASRRSRSKDAPMFFEAHNFADSENIKDLTDSASNPEGPAAESTYLSQSVMLGAIPGVDPKLTMIAVLSYPDSCGEVYPDTLKAFGNKFSILSPDRKMIRKILHVASLPPPEPSPDFWSSDGAIFAKSIDHSSAKKVHPVENTAANIKSMPDVTGKSLRAGLQVLQYLNLNIKLVGSGRIVSQTPPAGTQLKNSNECILQMQQEI